MTIVAGKCAVGERIVGTTCKKCSVGTYQDRMYQTMCIPCGGNLTTDREGATSATECLRKCTAVYESVPFMKREKQSHLSNETLCV